MRRPDALLPVRQAANMLGLSRQAVYAWVASGKIHHIKLPTGTIKIPESAVNSILQRADRPALAMHHEVTGRFRRSG